MSRRPQRIQMRRTRGWRLPDGAVNVARPTRWGNPFRAGTVGLKFCGPCHGDVGHWSAANPYWADLDIDGVGLSAGQAVSLYRACLEGALRVDDSDHPDDKARAQELRDALNRLRSRDLACWCPLDQPCHADVLIEVANR